MVASSQKGSYVSRITLAFLDSTGWYKDVNYEYGEKTVWGKNKNCKFFDIDNCDFDEFCSDSSFGCDWDATGIGRCRSSSFTGTCKIIRHYTNTICID